MMQGLQNMPETVNPGVFQIARRISFQDIWELYKSLRSISLFFRLLKLCQLRESRSNIHVGKVFGKGFEHYLRNRLRSGSKGVPNSKYSWDQETWNFLNIEHCEVPRFYEIF